MHQVTVHFIQSRIHTVRACLVRTCHCTLGRMTRIFYVLLQYHRSGTDSKMSRHRKLILEKKMFLPLKPDTCYHESGTPPLSYSLSWWPHELWHVKCANLCHANSWSTQFLILHVCVNRDVLQCRTVVAFKMWIQWMWSLSLIFTLCEYYSEQNTGLFHFVFLKLQSFFSVINSISTTYNVFLGEMACFLHIVTEVDVWLVVFVMLGDWVNCWGNVLCATWSFTDFVVLTGFFFF